MLFIPYLETGHYLGIEAEADLIKAGVELELGRTLLELKRPEIIVSGAFEFSKFSKQPDFAIAQSLFTHVTSPEIRLCMANLREVAKENARFYATFYEVIDPVCNPEKSDPHRFFSAIRRARWPSLVPRQAGRRGISGSGIIPPIR